jgi:hypothetical protein
VKANRALDAALALARNPGLAASMRGRPLPSGIPLLLQILADESDMVSSAAEALKLDQRSLRFAVEHYVQTVMLFAGAEPQRVLGVAPGATRAEMRIHLRWLMHWLHPDYNPAAWRSAFASRVLTAWREASSSGAVAKAREGPAFRNPGRRRSTPPPLPVYPPRLAWVARPLQESRRKAWPRAAGLCLALITLITFAVGDERVRSGLRDLAAALRTLTAID